jgi:hypothetical protein
LLSGNAWDQSAGETGNGRNAIDIEDEWTGLVRIVDFQYTQRQSLAFFFFFFFLLVHFMINVTDFSMS